MLCVVKRNHRLISFLIETVMPLLNRRIADNFVQSASDRQSGNRDGRHVLLEVFESGQVDLQCVQGDMPGQVLLILIPLLLIELDTLREELL